MKWREEGWALRDKLEEGERQIHWYWSAQGNTGKSSLVYDLCAGYSCCLNLFGKHADAIYILQTYIEAQKELRAKGADDEAKKNEKFIFLVDYPRDQNAMSYKLFESLVNSQVVATKYKGGDIMLPDAVVVIVFANVPPDESKMSGDRWNIVNVDPEPECESPRNAFDMLRPYGSPIYQ